MWNAVQKVHGYWKVGTQFPMPNPAPSVQFQLHTDWYMNGKPIADPKLLSKWRVAHWMGREKPWGVRTQSLHNQTYGEFKRDPKDMMSLPMMNRYWKAACLETQKLAPLVDCGTDKELSGG